MTTRSRATPTGTIENQSQADAARARLAKLDPLVLDLVRRHDDVVRRLGESLAGLSGDQRTDAGAIAVERVDVETELRDAVLARDSLRASVDAWDAALAERQATQARAELRELTATARRLEQQFVDQVRAVCATAAELTACSGPWQGARKVAGEVDDVPPRAPVFLGLHPELLANPALLIAAWLGEPLPPAPRRLVRDAVAEAAARQRGTTMTPSPVTFVMGMPTDKVSVAGGLRDRIPLGLRRRPGVPALSSGSPD